ncbi:putative tetratricopeptide repeat protein 41 [Antedon mediterranea]|uniref:putative tetratricopeptide repeat protein 41 n=1 Tax=Antedon mediterranea TaxID=105859 RepID=UPI003AF70518
MEFDDFQNKLTLRSLKRNFSVRQPIRPFISSTFTDFQIERDHLVKNVFQQLDAKSRQHGTSFSPIDLRWAITEEQLNSGHVVKLCLDYVNQCVPFYICLLGERYGSHRSLEEPPLPKSSKELENDANWLDKNFMNAAKNGFSWVVQESLQNSSITELEVIQAAFLNASPHVRFYFREMDGLEDLFSDLTEEWREEKLKLFRSESEYAELKMADLKKRITNKGLQVEFFRSPEQLGDLILKDWKEIINECYPPITLLLNEYGKEYFDDWCAHQALAATRTHQYVTSTKTLDLFEKLNSNAVDTQEDQYDSPDDVESVKEKSEDSPSVMVIVGKRGSGKTALLANWIKQFKQVHSGMMLLSHFVGSSAQSLDITTFMRRVTFELRENYSNDESEELHRQDRNDMDFNSLSEAFSAALLMGPCILVIDGLDELSGSYSANAQQVKEMTWLPNPIPQHCKIIVSTVKSDLSYKSLVSRPDCMVYCLPILSDSTSKTAIMKSHFKSIMTQHIDQALRCPLNDRPLFLTIIANELSISDSCELDNMLAQYCECTTFRELWRCIIDNWCKTYGWQRDGFRSSNSSGSNTESSLSGWVADLLCLLATSRQGMSEPELLSCLKLLGYSGQTEVTRFDFARFRLATQHCLFETPDGIIAFFHNHLREAVEHALLGVFGTGASDNLIGSSSVLMQSVLHRQKQFYSDIIAKYFWEQPHCIRRTFELPWQLDKIGDTESLSNVLSQPDMFLSMYGEDGNHQTALKIELMEYWKVLLNHHEPYDPAQIYKDMVLIAMQKHTYLEKNVCPTKDYEEVQLKFTELNLDEEDKEGEPDDGDDKDGMEPETINEAQEDVTNSSSHSEESFGESEVDNVPRHETYIARLALDAGKFLVELGNVEVSHQLFTIAHEQLVKSYPLSSEEQFLLVSVNESLGDWNETQSNSSEAAQFYQTALGIIGEIPDENDLKRCQMEQCKGQLMTHLGRKRMLNDDVIGAEELLKGAVDAMKNAKSTVGLATAYFNLGVLKAKQRKYQSSERSFRDALKMREKWFGQSHPVVAEVLHDLAYVLCKDHYKNFDKVQAEEYYRRSLSIRETHLMPDHLLVATTLLELGKLLRSIGTYQYKKEAASLLQRSLDIHTTTHRSNHKTTKSIRSSLKSLEKELQQGNYTDATSKQPDKRSKRQPFSRMSWHDKDLVEFERQSREKEKKIVEKMTVNRNSQEQERYSKYGSERSYPQSPSPFKLEALPATDYFNLSPGETEKVRTKSPGIISNYSGIQRSNTPKSKQVNDNKKIEFHQDAIDYEELLWETPEILAKRISCSAPIGQRTRHLVSKELKDRPFSSMSQVSHVSHWSKCNISSKFSIDVSNAMSVQGPHSNLDSLLGDPPCPRDVYRKPKYNSSWYHVPGRYPKHALDYPTKRQQSRPNKNSYLASISNKSSHESQHKGEFNLPSGYQE